MKPYKFFAACLSCLIFGAVFGFDRPAHAQTCNLSFSPNPGTGTVDIESYYQLNDSYTSPKNLAYLKDIVTVGNSTVPAGTYLGWCLDITDSIDNGPELYSTLMYSSCDPNLDAELIDLGADYHYSYPSSDTNGTHAEWNELNYLLNHKMPGASYWDIQNAIWNLIGGPAEPNSFWTSLGFNGLIYNSNNVAYMTQDAMANGSNWQPQCGDVMAVILAIPNADKGGDFPVQLTCLEVPVPCFPCISVSKTVACYQPTNNCGDFSKVAAGYAGAGCSGSGVDEPAFCYQISITNCGTIPLTNIVVSDNLLGLLTSNYFTNLGQVLAPGQGMTSVFSMSFPSTATNTVTVTGDSMLAGSVTNSGMVITNGTPVTATDSAVAQVDTASISCDLSLTSQSSLPGSTPNNLILPSATYYASSNTVNVAIHVCNTGNSTLTNVSITVPTMASFNCTPPGAFTLTAGQCVDFQLCMATVSCPAQPSFNVSVSGQVAPDATHCAVFDTNNSPITVCSACTATITCSNECVSSVSGTVYLHCGTNSVITAADSALPGITVTLLSSNNTLLATTTTDASGNYTFSGLAPGSYLVAVTVPPNYVETYPAGVVNGEIPVTITCQNVTSVNFGYADTTPPVIMVQPGSYLGCNPTNILTDSNLASLITASVSCGAATTNISHVDTNNGCSYTRVFTITVTDTYGNSATNYVTNTWTVASLVLTNVPGGGSLGCNPTNLPTDATISNAVGFLDSCSAITNSVTHVDTPSNCGVTRVFTISAVDACGDSAVAYVTNTWTVATLTLTNVPPGGPLGCNPTNIPTDASISNAVGFVDSCSTISNSVTHVDSVTNCAVTRVFTITASDICGDSATAYVTNTWTTASLTMTPPAGGPLGCNPASIPTDMQVSNAVVVNDSCSTVTLSVNHQDIPSTCAVTRIFTIVASDTCGDSSIAYVTNTWTTASLTLTNVPAGGALGCNPTNIPTDASISNSVGFVDSCSMISNSVTHVDSVTNCAVTRVFTITASDTCGDSATAFVTNTWTTATLTMTPPAGGPLGCNPASIPTDMQVSNAVVVNDSCSTVTLGVSHQDIPSTCAVTRIFTIVASDTCGDTTIAYVTNTWTTASLTLTNVPAGGSLGCNPPSLPTDASISNAVGFIDNCSTVSNNVSHVDSVTNCLVTRVFTITSSDTCGDTATAYVTNTWTLASLTMTPPTGSALGCNPAVLPTDTSISNAVGISDICSKVTLNVSHVDSSSNCAITRVFTINASDACGDSSTAYVTNTWTADTNAPVLSGVPASTNLGCNPTNIPTAASVQAAIKASDTCSPATAVVTASCSTNGCAVTQIFTITATNACNNSVTAYVTNTWTVDSAAPMLSNVPTGLNLGCNPTNIPTAASIQASVKATDTCSSTTVKVTGGATTNGCAVTQIFTITATNVCGNMATAYVTNTWTADSTPPGLTGVPAGKNLGCNPTNIPTAASIQSSVKASDTCSPATVTVACNITTNGCGVTQVFTILATNACGNKALAYVTNTWQSLPTTVVTNTTYATNISYLTNVSYVTNISIKTNVTIVTNIVITTNCCTNSICSGFNNSNPNGGWLWCNAHISGNPGSNCTVYCSNASLTLSCLDGKTYSFPISNSVINFSSSCTVATNWFDGATWHTTLPCTGDDQIFVQGCAIPWQSDFTYCQSACWTAVFSSSTPGFNCNWQWGAACYSGNAPSCGSIAPKACHSTSCPNGQYYSSSDYAGCPENFKPSCVAGGTGYGGNNCTGSWTGTSTTCTFGTKTNITTTPVTTYTTNTSVSTNYSTTPVTTILTNSTVTTAIEGPMLSGIPAGMNFGCNPTNIPTVSGLLGEISASETCSAANVNVVMLLATNGCAVTQLFTITASNACGGVATAYVTNTWTADTVPPVIMGVPPNTFLGCTSGTNLPGDSNVLSEIIVTDQCSTPSVTVMHVDTTNGCSGTRTFTITATDTCGNVATTNLVYTWTGHTPDYCTNSLCAGFNSKNPGSGWLWLNAHVSGYPGKDCTVYCQNATVTLSCTDGKSYSYNVPNGSVHFSASCTTATNWFDGANWNTVLPCAGDDQAFLQGCAIPWQSDFANCQSVCWTGVFTCDSPGQSFNWQWAGSCFANTLPAYTNICPKACHQTACPNGQYYGAGDCGGSPENHKPYCVAGGTGLGGTNCTGSWSGTDTTCTFTAGTSLPPVLNGVPANDNLGCNPTNVPTVASVLKLVTATDTCSPAPINVTCVTNISGCAYTQIFCITATNDCGAYAMSCVTNTWTTLCMTNHCTNTICSSFNSSNPTGCWLWLNSQLSGKPGTNEVYITCSNATVTLNCNNGKTYTFPVPCSTVHFSPTCTTATNWFDGTNWNTTLPCGGDDQIFLSGCAIPWNSDFVGCHNICWTGTYSCNQPGLSFNWQFGGSCYSGSQPGNYNSLCSKACHQTPCQNGQYFNQGHNAGTPENYNPNCVSGGTGYGGNNYTGNFCNPGTCNF